MGSCSFLAFFGYTLFGDAKKVFSFWTQLRYDDVVEPGVAETWTGLCVCDVARSRRKKRSEKGKVNSAANEQKISEQQWRSAFLNRLLGFKHFLSSGFEPKISDAEIIVCFADVRGFTAYCRKLQQEMQDRKIQNFLRDYFKIFNEGLVEHLSDDSLKSRHSREA